MSHRVTRAFRIAVGNRIRGKQWLRTLLCNAEERYLSIRHTASVRWPALAKPRPYKIMVALTAHCNSGCVGCRYGRDFMPGARLEWAVVRDLLEDAAAAGFATIRLYGGEPLLHPDLPRIIERCVKLGMRPYVTTNAVLLEQKIDVLVQSGLKDITVGFYGTGKAYDDYAQRPGYFARVERGIAVTRERYGDIVNMQLNWLLMRPTASVECLRDVVAFARRYGMTIRVDLIHYSLPYFQEGPERCLQFRPEDRGTVEQIVDELILVKQRHPTLLRHSVEGLRSIPDWLILGPGMRVPCTAYEMLWVGADGTVQMCYVTFRLGNLREQRLRTMLGTVQHRKACQDAVRLRCPNCHCSSNERIMRYGPARRHYAAESAHREPNGWRS